MADKISLKPGDTFLAHCTYKNAAGVAVNLTLAAIDIQSSVVSQDGTTEWPLAFSLRDQARYPGEYFLRAATAEWPIGNHLWDIRFSVPHETGEISTSTETKTIYFGVPVS